MPDSEASIYKFQHAELEIAILEFQNSPSFKTQDYSRFLQKIFNLPPEESLLQKLSDGSSQLLNSQRPLSISHKEKTLCLALGSDSDIQILGCDIEALNAADRDWRPFIGRFFNALDVSQIALYKSRNGIAEDEAYLTFFSIKEAVLKATRLSADPILFSIGYNDTNDCFFINAPKFTGLLSENLKLGKFQWGKWLVTFAYRSQKAL